MIDGAERQIRKTKMKQGRTEKTACDYKPACLRTLYDLKLEPDLNCVCCRDICPDSRIDQAVVPSGTVPDTKNLSMGGDDMKYSAAAVDLLFPPKCVFCNRLLPAGRGEPVCDCCETNLPVIKPEQRMVFGESYLYCLTPFHYEVPLSDSFLRYKFQGREGYAAAYGRWLRSCLAEEKVVPPDLITWAPLSSLRRWSRGYDQARLLAMEAAKLYDMTPKPLLKKVRHTRRQSALLPQQRKKNAKNAYALLPGAQVQGKRILLVDDVITTGATLEECSRVLTQAGAGEIICLTLARGHGGSL